MKYRAFYKDTWYECEDYGALCRCLTWCGADSFVCFSTSELCNIDMCDVASTIIWREDEEN